MSAAVLSIAVGAGCSGPQPSSYEQALAAYIEQLEALADVLESVDDEASANSAAEKLEEIGERLRNLKPRLGALTERDRPRPSPEDSARLSEVSKRFAAAGQRLSADPRLAATLREAMAAATVSP